jgi:hypothetical protein
MNDSSPEWGLFEGRNKQERRGGKKMMMGR